MAALLVLASAPGALAQNPVSVLVSVEPATIPFDVDGQHYTGPASFVWAIGSKHVVSIPPECPAGDCGTRFGVNAWETENGEIAGKSVTQVITIDGSFHSLKARLKVEHLIEIALPPKSPQSPLTTCAERAARPPDRPGPAEGIGLLLIGEYCFDFLGGVWLEPGDYQVQAMAFGGYVFAGWTTLGTPAGSVRTYRVQRPDVLTPRFVKAKRVQVLTDPDGMSVVVDRSESPTQSARVATDTFPGLGVYDWLPGSKHVLAVRSPQSAAGAGGLWVFQAWEAGVGPDGAYQADEDVFSTAVLKAKFAPGVPASVMTEPAGLRLRVDGRDNWASYNFVWAAGSAHRIEAPAVLVDSNGRRWTFRAWAHGGTAAQEIRVAESAVETGGLRFQATYDSTPRLTVTASVPGAAIAVDGTACAVPCLVDRPRGTTLTIEAARAVGISSDARYEFAGWSDGGPARRTVTLDRDTIDLRALYRRAVRLSVIVDPPAAGSVVTDPHSVDGFYPEGTWIGATASAGDRFRFRRWEGDVSGSTVTNGFALSEPMTVIARFASDDRPMPIVVRNAAGATPHSGVAPGSLIAIVSDGLTDAAVTSPPSALSQTLGGVSVSIDDRILPLLAVSPTEITALLPSDTAPGTVRVTVNRAAATPRSAEVEVVRNAPGLFTCDGIAVAFHENGQPVTVDNPAHVGDRVTLIGTGFGPYDRAVVDGFPLPSSPAFPLADANVLTIDGLSVDANWAGGIPGLAGVSGVRFRIPPSARPRAQVQFTVNGVQSNIVTLPVR